MAYIDKLKSTQK